MAKQQCYSVDIGTWEKGQCVSFWAADDDAAIRKASDISKAKNKKMVQVRRGATPPGTIIWDEINGKLNV